MIKFHKAKTDTGKINSIEEIVEESWDANVWPKYNNWLLDFTKKSLYKNPEIQVKNSLLNSHANALNNLGYFYQDQGKYELALDRYNEALVIKEVFDDQHVLAALNNNIGTIYNRQGDLALALKYYTKALKAQETIGDKFGMSLSYNNIGSIHGSQEDYSLAREYYIKGLKLKIELEDDRGIANAYNNIGVTYNWQNDNESAYEYYHKALTIREEINDTYGIAETYSSLGALHNIMGDFKQALKYHQKALKIRESSQNVNGISVSHYYIGLVYKNEGNINLAIEHGEKALTFSQDIGIPDDIQNAATLLSELYENQGKGIRALEMFKLSIQMRDSLRNKESQKKIASEQAKYLYEKQKTIDDAEYNKSLAIEKEQKEKQQILTIATSFGLLLVVLFLFFLYNRLRITRKQKLLIEDQKQQVEKQKQAVELAHTILEEKNQEILDSISYAKRIQLAILPPNQLIKEHLKSSFILYKPKDIVAGDFYWLEHRKDKTFFAAADCTGHGVPGAMVSVICNNALNRSVREYQLTSPGEILDKAREIVIQEFEKSDEDVKDGMDIALCTLEGNILQYAGANNPLWIIRDGQIKETKADKQPIGKFDKFKSFTTHTIEVQKDDTIYIFSDGYVDQFGGEKGKKFKAQTLRLLLLSIQDKSMEDQKNELNHAFESWRGNLEQIDDVCVMGIKI